MLLLELSLSNHVHHLPSHHQSGIQFPPLFSPFRIGIWYVLCTFEPNLRNPRALTYFRRCQSATAKTFKQHHIGNASILRPLTPLYP